MALPTSYSTLQTWLLDWLDRDTSVPVVDFIALAEGEMNSRLRLRHNTTTASLSLSSGTSSITLPSDYLELLSLSWTDGADPPRNRDRAFVDNLAQDTTVGRARPAFYSINATTLNFERPADATYSLFFRYFQRWNIASTDTNWLLINKPAIYLGLCLRRASRYLTDPAAADVWSQEAERDIIMLINEDARERAKGLTARVDQALTRPGRYDILSDTFTNPG